MIESKNIKIKWRFVMNYLTEIFTGVIAVVAVITFFRGIPTKRDFERLVDRFDRHLEYHSRIKEN
jgi:hypothetical protein